MVVAAGNYGRLSVYGSNGFGTITAPGNDPYVITVGAMKSMGTYPRPTTRRLATVRRARPRMTTSSKPDIMADGNGVISLSAPGATLETRVSESTWLLAPTEIMITSV